VINHARNIIFMATGANKGPIIKQLFYTDSDLPAARVRPTHGHLLWLLDEALQKAASLPLLHQCQ
jgi:6-phosphogluconolactonase/glucosamine-6-phosphate isomerase/deaminase